MTKIQTLGGIDRPAIDRLLAQEPDWLGDLRRAAFARYERLPQPDATLPGWRRLSLDGIDLRAPVPAPTVFSSDVLEADRKRGLIVCSLTDAIRSHEPQIRQALSLEHSGKSVGRYAAVAEAAWQRGVFVYAPDRLRAEGPVRIDLSAGAYPRIVVVAGEGAELTVAETHREADPVSAGVVDLVCGAGSLVRYLHVQDCAKNSAAFSHQRAVLQRDARLITLNFGIGGRLARTDVEVELCGVGAESDMLGLVFAEDRQQFDYRTLQGHRSPDTRSDLLFKAALDDQSHASYTGVIVIDRGAQRSDAYQANRNLLLKDGARADTEPMLEIEADDVRCTHGATVGPIDEEQLFYARSRGLAVDAAARLIVEGFFAEVFEKFGNAAVTDPLRGVVAPHLGRVGAA